MKRDARSTASNRDAAGSTGRKHVGHNWLPRSGTLHEVVVASACSRSRRKREKAIRRAMSGVATFSFWLSMLAVVVALWSRRMARTGNGFLGTGTPYRVYLPLINR